MMRNIVRKFLVAPALGSIAFGSLALGVGVPPTPAKAQLSVFDPTNYSQNILTAARTLQQVNNQIQSLQNEATMLINQSKNLTRIDFPQLQAITQTLQQIDRLMGQAQSIRFQVAGLDQQFGQLYPRDFGQALRLNQQVIGSRSRLDASMDAFRHTMMVQAQVVENVSGDAQTLSDIMSRSQGSEGSLQAQQATNQLLAMTAKQQFQIQSLMAAQYRADAIEAARRVQAEQEARTATRKFLGTGQAYTPR
jgi:P-type conjugative transfer protein TrbJ